VLAQNPETGELAYKGVLVTTVRPPSEMLTIRAVNSAITATLGHPFFVVGKGWRMAKELKDDDWVYAQGETLPIDAIEKAEPVEAHNLMVLDFGTYFVGKDRVLVHDNSPIPPARLEIPGLFAVSVR
jgi:intein/homing endonuclease